MDDTPKTYLEARPGVGRFLFAICPRCRARVVILQVNDRAEALKKCDHANGITVDKDAVMVRFLLPGGR